VLMRTTSVVVIMFVLGFLEPGVRVRMGHVCCALCSLDPPRRWRRMIELR
jgi:hypothetical protein